MKQPKFNLKEFSLENVKMFSVNQLNLINAGGVDSTNPNCSLSNDQDVGPNPNCSLQNDVDADGTIIP